MKPMPQLVILLAIGLFALAGCATPVSSELKQARQSYSAAQIDPSVSNNASVTLYEAKKALDQAEQAEELEAQKHYAYLTEQRIALAQAQARNAENSQAALELREQQQAYLMQRRQRMAEQATREAEQAKQKLSAYRSQEKEAELASARQQAEQYQSELEKLRKEIADAETRSTDKGLVVTMGEVIFEYDRAQLKPGAERSLARIASFLQQNPRREILVEGFTDSQGGDQYNQQLSERRAQAVAQALRAAGIESERITTRGLGEQYPVATNETPAGRQQNRRVEITILNPGSRSAEAGRENNN